MSDPNPITATRRSIQTYLTTAGLTAWEIAPDQGTPPGIIVDADDPSLDFEGVAGGEVNLHHVAIVVAASAVNIETAEALDSMTTATVAALADSPHSVDHVGRYGQTVLNGQAYPAIEIYISTYVRF